MFGFSMGEMLLLMAIALIAIGPKQLPEVARTLGKFMNELKRATSDFSRSFTEVADDTKNSWDQARKGVNEAFTAGAQAYNDSVRAAPEGAVSTNAPPPGTPGTHPITPEDPFGVGHNANAHDDAQQSLFVPTDLSGVHEDHHPQVDPHQPVEEQLAFQLTTFDDEGEGKS